MPNVVVAIGTRPDVIKMRPLIDLLWKDPDFKTMVWWSGQGKDLQDGEILPIEASTGGVNWKTGCLSVGIGETIKAFGNYLKKAQEQIEIDAVIVHGDDGTAFACGLAAWQEEIPVAHVEAGLRTHNPYSPWPEEM